MTFLCLTLITALNTYAHDLGNSPGPKPSNPVSPIQESVEQRQGGEDMSDAFPILELPFNDTGNTSNASDDYDATCPYPASTGPDVVYSYIPPVNMLLRVDLCGSAYDTKTYILDGELNVIACNDDFYFDDICGTYVSFIEGAELFGGIEYFVVVDGYGGDSGEYILSVDAADPPPPCVVECDGFSEGEPDLTFGYVDYWNGGCNTPELEPFQDLSPNVNGELTLCGVSGWYEIPGGNSRDTDWYAAVIGDWGYVEWTLDAEQETLGLILLPNDCETVTVVESYSAGPCAPVTISITGNPGEVIWLWVGPSTFEPPVGAAPEYTYISTYSGLDPGCIISTESTTLDMVKSLYR